MKKYRKREYVTSRTRENIISVASCLFSEYTYLGVSMSDIAKRLNITKAALYYHFKSKAEIYREVLDQIFYKLKPSIIEASGKKGTINKKLYEFIKNYLDFDSKEKDLIRVLTLKISPNSSEVNKYIVKLRERIVNLIQSFN